VNILISAGEASGEMYGAQLIEALRKRNSNLRFFGAGGDRMRAAGCDIVVDARDLAVVGITEIVSHLPKILGLYRNLLHAADERRPSLAIVIDSPAFNWRVARQMQKRGIPVVYYVCPQFWAWRQGRVKLLRKYVSKALVIFPFEEKFYRDRGVDATFVGHPLAGVQPPSISREQYAVQYGLDPNKQWITLMPGSRRKEVRMNLPTMLEAAVGLGATYEFLLPVAPTLDAAFLKSLTGAAKVHFVLEALPALFHSRGGIIASGTATVEAAIMGTPFVMVYRVSPITYALGRPQVKVPYFAMVNLIAGEQAVPELVQDRFTAENVVRELNQVLADGPQRTRMIEQLAEVKEKMRSGDGGASPPDRAAEIIVRLLG
jgi:lipid-A-disaccharide synthase